MRRHCNILLPVQLEAEPPDAGLLCLLHEAGPVWDHHLVPLPRQHPRRLGRPGRRDPVRVGVPRPAGAAGHHHHPVHAHEPGQKDRARRHVPMPLADCPRVQRVAGAVERADRQIRAGAAYRATPGARPRPAASGRDRGAARSTSFRTRTRVPQARARPRCRVTCRAAGPPNCP